MSLQCPTQIYFSVKGEADLLEIYSTSEILIDNWYHLAVTLNGEQLKIYLNGKLEDTVAVSGNVSSDAGFLKFGVVTAPNHRALDGSLDEVRIYNRALSQEEVQEDMDLCHPKGYDATLHSLKGVIQGNFQEGIKVELSGDYTDITYTDELGRFSFLDLPAGEYTITPQYENCSFIPSIQQVTLDRLNLNQITFEAFYTGNQSLGIKLWEFETETGGIIISSPTVLEDKVFLGDFGGDFYCLNTENGEKLWEYSVRSPEDEIPLCVTESIVDENRVYVASGTFPEPLLKPYGKLICLDVEDGSLIWEKSMGSIESWPALYNDNLYVGTCSGKLHCLKAETGETVWSYQFGNEEFLGNFMEGGQAIYRGRVYFTDWPGNVYCLDAQTGEELWVSALGIFIASSPAFSKDRLYTGRRIGFGGSGNNGMVYCLNANTGEVIWSYETGGAVFSSPTLDGEKVYFGSFDGYVYCLDAETGQEVWKFQTWGNVWNYHAAIDDFCSPTVVKGKVYVGAWDNHMYCLNGETGEKLWSYDSGIVLKLFSAAVSRGKVFFGSMGKIFCLKAGSEEVGEWPMFHKNLYRTGSTSVISGKIVDEKDVPLSDAELVVSGVEGTNLTTVTTNSDDRGYYEFTELPEGTYTVRASAQGYSRVSEKVTLNPLTPIDDLDFTLQPSICPATFALGGDSKDLITLRIFRDEILSKTPEGQEIIRLYYQWSPAIVDAMLEDEEFKIEVKVIIDGILPMIRELVE